MKKGDTGKLVKIAQYMIGYTKELGIFTKELEDKVINFQKLNGLKPNGAIDNNTFYELVSSAPIAKKSKIKKNINRAWQLMIEVNCDGIFGNETLTKTKEFQKKNGLLVDGEVGPKTWCKALSLTKPNYAIKQPVNYKQIDKKWKDIVYTYNGTYSKKQTIGNSGCGPTSMADVIATYWDDKITPIETCKFAVENYFRRKTGGTDGKFFTFMAEKYGGSCLETTSHTYASEAANKGHLVIVSVGPSRWANGGHYIVLWKVSGSTCYINDPYSYSSYKEKAPWDTLKKARKKYYIIYK